MYRYTLQASLLWLAALTVPAAAQDTLSTSIMRPSALNSASGTIAGALPGGEGSRTFYIAADLKSGDLLAQLSVAGRANTQKKLTLELLGSDARAKHSYYVMAGLETTGETTRTYPVDATGRHILRIVVEGKETGSFCVLLGGSALPVAKATGCPGQEAPPQREASPSPRPVAPAPTPPPVVKIETPPLPKVVEVIETRCEQRLRIGADVLFDFDRSEFAPTPTGRSRALRKWWPGKTSQSLSKATPMARAPTAITRPSASVAHGRWRTISATAYLACHR